MKALSWENMKSYHRPQWTPLIWDSHGSEFTSAALATAILKQVVACSKLQDRKEIGSKKVARKRAGAGGSRSSGACKNCFQYLIPVYQLLVYPMIGQQNVTIWIKHCKDTKENEGKRRHLVRNTIAVHCGKTFTRHSNEMVFISDVQSTPDNSNILSTITQSEIAL